MKSILFTSTALVAFAGAAAAEQHTAFDFTGEATLGYNDASDVSPVAGDGFYWDATVATTMSAELNGGLTAAATFEVEVVDGNIGQDLLSTAYVLSLSSDVASLSVGDLDPVAEDRWDGVDGATVADFNDQDTHFLVAGFEAMLVGEASLYGFDAAISYGLDSGAGNAITGEMIDAMQVHVAGTFGDFGMQLAYQEEFGPTPEIFGVSGSASFAGADIQVSYIDDGTESSTGIGVAYPVGPVVIGGYYSMNDVAEDNYGVSLDYINGPIAVSAAYDIDGSEVAGVDDLAEYSIDASYDVGNGLQVLAGAFGSDAAGDDVGFYVASVYDLGGGAEILFSYADDGEDAVLGADLGDPEYKEGITVEASFAF